jgi:hypothetical protein
MSNSLFLFLFLSFFSIISLPKRLEISGNKKLDLFFFASGNFCQNFYITELKNKKLNKILNANLSKAMTFWGVMKICKIVNYFLNNSLKECCVTNSLFFWEI